MEDSSQRILHVFGSLDRGGAEAMIMNLYRQIDKDLLQFDFLVNATDKEYAHEKEIRDLGGRIFRVPQLSPGNIRSYYSAFSRLLREHTEWKVVHVHNTSTAFLSLPIAKKHGRITIAHSHTAGSDGSLKARIKILSRLPVKHLADHLLSCSQPAAKWMFGSHSKRACILNNAIDTAAFFPDYEKRLKIRKSLGISAVRKVIGHVGRFMEVKNHAFMLSVLEAMLSRDHDYMLVLVGDGPLKPIIMQQAESMGLADHVLFAGMRADIPDLMQGMDVFIFPSLHEGLPVTLVEAQANGLPCLVSDTVSQEVKLTPHVEFLSLKALPHEWAVRLEQMANSDGRQSARDEIALAGYDVIDNAKWIEQFYFNLLEPA